MFSPSDIFNGDIGNDDALNVLIMFASIGVRVSVDEGRDLGKPMLVSEVLPS